VEVFKLKLFKKKDINNQYNIASFGDN